MFESAALGRCYPQEDVERIENEVRMKLFAAQGKCLAQHIPLLIIIDGVDGSGRGAVANMLSEWMDAKSVRDHVFWLQTEEERTRPEAWRFWNKMPAAGEIGVFLGGWYGNTIRRVSCGDISESAFSEEMYRWRRFEQMLVASGMVIVKFWLHLSRKVHKNRLKERLKERNVHHFTPYDKKSSEHYDELVSAAAKAITLTDGESAPWTIIDAFDSKFRNISVAQSIIGAVEKGVALRAQTVDFDLPDVAAEERVPVLGTLDLTKTCEYSLYKRELGRLQEDIYDLTFRAYKRGISTTILFEGWDAAGKGGAIRRLTAGIDARITRVIPISAPSDEELAHHYLWRFWRHIPRAGFVTIYDRSWYGRVLVERVEKLTPPRDWQRAYAELNDFEEQLQEKGNILLKFWLHISSDEQLRRFREREETPWKQYKITPDDWRNRDKKDAYVEAAEEMFMRTSTVHAPWHLIPAEDKKYARIEVLRTYRDALKKALSRK